MFPYLLFSFKKIITNFLFDHNHQLKIYIHACDKYVSLIIIIILNKVITDFVLRIIKCKSLMRIW